jgi:hypothetical protein
MIAQRRRLLKALVGGAKRVSRTLDADDLFWYSWHKRGVIMVAMTAEQAAEWGKTRGFEHVWAATMKNDEQLARLEQTVAETQKVAAETSRKNDEQLTRLEQTVRKPKRWWRRPAGKLTRWPPMSAGLTARWGN